MTNYIQVIKKLHKATAKNLFYKTGYVLIFCGITGCFLFGIQSAVAGLLSLLL